MYFSSISRPTWLARGQQIALALALLLAAVALCAAEPVQTLELELEAENARKVPVWVTFPAAEICDPCQLIAFSHGAYATPPRYRRLIDAWAARGYVVVAARHVDSEESATRDDYDRTATLRTRLEDFGLLVTSSKLRAAIDSLELELRDEVIAAGHSFGALMAQASAGATLQEVPQLPESLLAARKQVTAVLALSPPPPMQNYVGAEDWARINRPMLVVTGTTDEFPGFVDDWQMHLASYEAAPDAPAYAMVFAEQDHYFNGAFGRPADVIADETVTALQTLNNELLAFIAVVNDGQLPSGAEWRDKSTPLVETRRAN